MRTPIVLVTGIDPDAMASAQLGLQFDLPRAVSVRHRLDPEAGTLERVVSDMGGVIEHEVLHLRHACVSCALREDVVPTIDRLVCSGRWSSVLVRLPVGAEADQVCAVIGSERSLVRRMRVVAVVAALDAETIVDDLLGSDTLAERGRHASDDDERGVGEVACSMVEAADVVLAAEVSSRIAPLAGGPAVDPAALDLAATLARPGAEIAVGVERLDAVRLLERPPHRLGATRAWAGHVREGALPPPVSNRVWSLDLTADRALHPGRLLDDLESLAAGRFRTRGCFWMPTRPGAALLWDGAGGQLSIGAGEPWGRRRPRTRLGFVGVGAAPAHLVSAFEGLLLPEAAAPPSVGWHQLEDGFEPWLGPIRDAA